LAEKEEGSDPKERLRCPGIRVGGLRDRIRNAGESPASLANSEDRRPTGMEVK